MLAEVRLGVQATFFKDCPQQWAIKGRIKVGEGLCSEQIPSAVRQPFSNCDGVLLTVCPSTKESVDGRCSSIHPTEGNKEEGILGTRGEPH